MINSNAIFNINTNSDFESLTFEIFKFQFENNPVYRSFCDLLYKNPSDIRSITEIPFLPIQFFKTHSVLSSKQTIQQTFTSSGTTSIGLSKHHITELNLYESSFINGFELCYGKVEDYAILALLPSYLEREGSSLVYMIDHFIKRSKHPESGFYLNDHDALSSVLTSLDKSNKKILLIGVSFGLLDLIESRQFNLKNCIVMETGGMKGRRKEMIREELHDRLKAGFGVSEIHSEYGMTELLSQAYSIGDSHFKTPPWMKVLVRDPEDAFTILPFNKTGGLNIIDLANINSCSFIATQDLGRNLENGSFEILGRFDHSDIRGCNLMVL